MWPQMRGKSSLLTNLIVKDFKLLRRDLTQFMQFFMFAIMMVVMAVLFRRDMDTSGSSLAESLLAFIFIWFFSAMSTVGLATRLFPLEGKTFYLAKISPQPYFKMISAKLMLCWILGSLVAVLGVTVVTLLFKYTMLQFFLALFISTAVCLGISGIGLAIGASFANYDWDNPKRMISTGGGLIAGILPMLFLAILLLISIAVLALTTVLGYSELLGLMASIFIIAILSSVTAYVSIKLASRKIDKLAWRY
jgi:hypothetical protein